MHLWPYAYGVTCREERASAGASQTSSSDARGREACGRRRGLDGEPGRVSAMTSVVCTTTLLSPDGSLATRRSESPLLTRPSLSYRWGSGERRMRLVLWRCDCERRQPGPGSGRWCPTGGRGEQSTDFVAPTLAGAPRERARRPPATTAGRPTAQRAKVAGHPLPILLPRPPIQ